MRRALRDADIAWRELGALFRLVGDGATARTVPRLAGTRVDVRPPNLEDVFLTLTGRELREE